MSIKIYHNPRCSKSRATLELLHASGVEPEIRLYLEDPPSMDELASICSLLSMEPTAFMRFNEAVAKEMGIAATDSRSQSDWCQLIHEHPILLERPIVVADKGAAIGRPPENVLQLI